MTEERAVHTQPAPRSGEQRANEPGDTGILEAREVEKLTQRARDVEAKLTLLEEGQALQRGVIGRISELDGTLRQVQEALAALQRQVAEAHEQTEHQVLLRATEAERDRRSVAELAQRLADLQRSVDAGTSRVQALGEEARRDRSMIAQLGTTLDDVTRRQSTLNSRIQQVEEVNKRVDAQFVAIQQRDERTQSTLEHLDNWQKLADVRWGRQLGEWQQQAQVWKDQLDEQAKPVQQLVRQVARLQEDVQALAGQIAEQQKRLDAQVISLQRLEGLLTITRDASARLEQAADAQRRRADEQNASIFRMEERLQDEIDRFEELSRRIDAQETRVEELSSLVRVVDSQRQRAEDGVAALQQQVVNIRNELAEQLGQLADQVRADRTDTAGRLAALAQVQLQERRRRLAAAQQEVNDWSDLVRPDAGQRLSGAAPES